MKINAIIFTTLFLGFNTLYAQTFEWARSFGGTTADRGRSIAVDDLGNVYTTGYFQGTVDLNSGAGTSILTSEGHSDVFIQKMDTSGNFLWAKSFGGTGNTSNQGFSIAVDDLGNVYTTGYFKGTGDFDPGVGTSILTSEGHSDVFIQKMDISGNFLWAKSFGGTDSEGGRSIAVDDSGNVYTTGNFNGAVDFNPSTGTSILTSEGDRDVFIQKLDASGNFLWAKRIGGTDS